MKKKKVIITDVEKDDLIKQIKTLDNSFDKLGIDLYKFTKEELEKHLEKLKRSKNV